MAATDVLSDQEARVAIGLQATDTTHDNLLLTYNAATTKWLDDVCLEPIVSRSVADCGAVTDSNTIPITATDQQWAELHKTQSLFRRVSIGATFAEVAYGRDLLELDQAAGTIVIGGLPVTTTGADTIRVGWFADTASVDADLKLAANAHLAWLWQRQRGQAGAFESFDVVPDIPWAVYSMIPDRYAPGAV